MEDLLMLHSIRSMQMKFHLIHLMLFCEDCFKYVSSSRFLCRQP